MANKFMRMVAACAFSCMLAFACVGLNACGGGSGSGQAAGDDQAAQEAVELQIFAANSLEQAMPLVQDLYTQAHPNVTFKDSQFKASGDLVEEIGAGAAPDILITASKATMDDAEAFIIPESRITMFGNDLVVCAAADSDLKIDELTDLESKKIKKIAIGDPAFVPAGKYANQSLNATSISDPLYSNAEGEGGAYASSIKDKIVLANQVGTCAQWVASGTCDIGFIYSSDLYRYKDVKNIYTVPEDMHKVITYPGAVLADSKSQQAAADFLEFCMTDSDALAIWQDNGFELK